MQSDTDETSDFIPQHSISTPTYHSNNSSPLNRVNFPINSTTFSKLKSKTPTTLPITPLGTEHDHIGGIYHDVLYDNLIHEFDETYVSDDDDDDDDIDENGTPDVMEFNSVFLNSESTASSSVCSYEYPSKESSSSVRKTESRLQTIKEIEFYLSCKRILWITTLFAVGAHEFIYYDHYYICGLFAWITCVLYMILLTITFNNKYNISWCSFTLVMVRLFHMVSVISLCFGVFHCQYTYNIKTLPFKNEDKISMLNQNLKTFEKYLYASIFIAIISCWIQNFYVIKYNEFVVKTGRGIYCSSVEYFILENGLWRNDMQPITFIDRLFAYILLLATFGAIMVCVMSINRMETVGI
eukprot:188507_1